MGLVRMDVRAGLPECCVGGSRKLRTPQAGSKPGRAAKLASQQDVLRTSPQLRDAAEQGLGLGFSRVPFLKQFNSKGHNG